MKPKFTSLGSSHNRKSLVAAVYVSIHSNPQGRKVTNKCLTICFDCSRKLPTLLKMTVSKTLALPNWVKELQKEQGLHKAGGTRKAFRQRIQLAQSPKLGENSLSGK